MMGFRKEMKRRLSRLKKDLGDVYTKPASYTLSHMQARDRDMKKEISNLRREIAMMKVAAVDGVRVEGDTVYVTSTIPEGIFSNRRDGLVLDDLIGIYVGADCVPHRFYSRGQLVSYMEGTDGT